MVAVIESAYLPLDVDRVWAELGHFGDVSWHPLLVRVESVGNHPGALRHVEAQDGTRKVERLDLMDPEHHLYRYSGQNAEGVMESYLAELRIEELGPRSSLVTWSAMFEVTGEDEDAEAENVRRFLRVGLDALQRRYCS